jgi:hypothetical protein
MGPKVPLWALFDIGVPLMTLPLVLVVCFALNARRTLFEIIKDGQLYIFSAALAAITIYDISKHVFGSTTAISSTEKAVFLSSLGSLIFSLMWATAFYGVSVVVNFATPAQGGAANPHVSVLGWMSLTTLIGTVAFVLVFRYILDVF